MSISLIVPEKAQVEEVKQARVHLAALRWPSGPRCRRCDNPLTVTGPRLRCPKCGCDLSLFAGTALEGSKLKPAQWLQAARIFARARRGLSVRQMHADLGVRIETAQGILKVFRTALIKWGSLAESAPNVLWCEVVVGPRLFILGPVQRPGRAASHLLLVCGVRVGARGQPTKIQTIRAARLKDGAPTTLANAIKAATNEACLVFGFEGARFSCGVSLSAPAFLQERHGAGGEFKQRLDELREFLVSIPHGRFGGAGLDALLAEHYFRASFRVQHSNYIADRLLEQVLADRAAK